MAEDSWFDQEEMYSLVMPFEFTPRFFAQLKVQISLLELSNPAHLIIFAHRARYHVDNPVQGAVNKRLVSRFEQLTVFPYRLLAMLIVRVADRLMWKVPGTE